MRTRRPVVVHHFGDVLALHVLIPRRGHLQRRGQIRPELEAVHAAGLIALRHLLMKDAAAGGHPLNVAGAEAAAVAETVAVFDRAGEHVGDRLDAAMRMPREPGEIVVGTIVAKVVEQQKRVVVGGVAESERAAELDAGAFERGFRRDDFFDGSDGHVRLLITRTLSVRSTRPQSGGFSLRDTLRRTPPQWTTDPRPTA